VGALVPVDLGQAGHVIGTGLFWAGLGLMALAAVEFLRVRTTPVPRASPQALITSGIFRITRNPIYLGDALVLAGLCLRWEASLALILVPLFVLFIDRRFIQQEEQTLSTAFPESYPAYLTVTRRWI
jgi:protein-S-isoprenylcysteine O-methyltransferase Ste14